MELLRKANAVRLRSHLDKYLTADDDRQTVRQSRVNATTPRSVWLIELPPAASSPQTVVRLRNQHTGLYLFASDDAFLLGWTGKRVVQAPPPILLGSGSRSESESIGLNWEVIRDGFQVKLKTWKDGGKLLRANGGTPPWRNTVTHDVPVSGATGNWTLWDVEPVVGDGGVAVVGIGSCLSPLSSTASSMLMLEGGGFESFDAASAVSSVPSSPLSCRWSPNINAKNSPASMKKTTGMDFFLNAKAVRLRSIHGKYLTAEEDEESVTQSRQGSSPNNRWTVEYADAFIRFKSCYGRYLTASDHAFLLGMTGKKVTQTLPPRGGRQPTSSAVDWEPVPENAHGASSLLVKLRTRTGNFLRANSGPPPYRSSVTHDKPFRSTTQEWILWHVDVVEILDHVHIPDPPPKKPVPVVTAPMTPPRPQVNSPRRSRVHSTDSFSSSDGSSFASPTDVDTTPPQKQQQPPPPPKLQDGGRLIYYHIADDDGRVINDEYPGYTMAFKGKSVEELTRKLEAETGIQGIIVCTRSPLNGNLYPLRLHLPPNNATMHVVLVEPSSRVARNFEATGLL